MAAAEHFRDEGHNVLFLFDSITRFAEAHRETGNIEMGDRADPAAAGKYTGPGIFDRISDR